MRINTRSKLIIGYITLLFSVIVAASYGYYSITKVIKRKEQIRFYTDNLILSNRIYKHMSEATKALNKVLLNYDKNFVIKVTENLQFLIKESQRLKILSAGTGDPNQIDIADAIVESAKVYSETFHYIVESILRRGIDNESGLRGKLKQIRENLNRELPRDLILNMRILEMQNQTNYLNANTTVKSEYLLEFITDHIPLVESPNTLSQLVAYKVFFNRLFFEDMNIRDLIVLMRLNIEMIEIFVTENVEEAQSALEEQFVLTGELEQRQKVLSLLVTVFTISTGLLAIIVFGTKPLALASLNQEKAAILEAIRDGLVAVNRDAKVTLINQRAKDLLGLRQNYVGKHILELFPNSRLPTVMKNGIAEYDQEQQRGKITVLTTRIPVFYQDKIIGAIVCFRKKEELSRLAGKLTQVNAYIDSLRANNHEFKNKLQTIQGMIQLGKIPEVLTFIQSVQASHQQQISMFVDHIKDPAISAILLGKYNRAHELGISLFLDDQSKLHSLPYELDQNGLVSIIGNLIENAIDAVRSLKHMKRQIHVSIKDMPDSIYFSVTDNGEGIEPEIAGKIFQQGFSTKQIFDPMQPNSSDSPGEKHIGMGLYITRNHVISMGGSIQFKSDRQTTFEVSIPKYQA
ncbi:MAG: GHKL domain-containing protein [Deltaproteobacteria bacterium]|jgi:signal transduction histidine kinase|nr:GHKL domain-containing protein [Deltaproteobacteria bacterium]MBT4266188.1 GHKL domain-containing protein [Deltaproteobacteria bacterium]MBT4641197.1 GHKL domain-containing protein [Deltaproteobacteria bacterium]MBT7155028.1 GHKL domain-containing protein [Deltaproteobacteria bacterium]MBT7713840.1 GHKL domain-containing protein [Deltaproteobacteria bacterium]